MHSARFIFIILISCISCSVMGMTFDNRHIPLLWKPILRHDDVNFFFRVQPFIMFADQSSLRDEEDDEKAGLFDFEGFLHQHMLDKALNDLYPAAHKPIRSDIAEDLRRLSWSFPGRLDAAGAALSWYYRLNPHWEVGGSWLFIGARSRLDRVLRDNDIELTEGDKRDVEKTHELSMLLNKTQPSLWSKVGVGDVDLYLRLGMLRHFFFKCKTFDAGLKLGLIAPLADRRNIFNPASIPFGGNGHWGIYVDGAIDTELKDDLFAGLNMRFIQRFARTELVRMPLRDNSMRDNKSTNENDKDTLAIPRGIPLHFTPAIGLAQAQPGLTFVFSPYLGFGGIRDGFGAQVQYNLILHAHDTLHDRRRQQATPLDQEFFHHRSSWAREYVTISILYDFGQGKECRGRAPLLSLDVDYPVGIFASNQSFKTVGISLRIESDLW